MGKRKQNYNEDANTEATGLKSSENIVSEYNLVTELTFHNLFHPRFKVGDTTQFCSIESGTKIGTRDIIVAILMSLLP